MSERDHAGDRPVVRCTVTWSAPPASASVPREDDRDEERGA